jgi:hypothetical protein
MKCMVDCEVGETNLSSCSFSRIAFLTYCNEHKQGILPQKFSSAPTSRDQEIANTFCRSFHSTVLETPLASRSLHGE